MRNETVLNLCIADVNELLTRALTEHVLKEQYQVKEVFWSEREMTFKITLVPSPVAVSIPCGTGQAS